MIREAVVAHISLSLAEGERQLQQLAYSINARNCSVAVLHLDGYLKNWQWKEEALFLCCDVVKESFLNGTSSPVLCPLAHGTTKGTVISPPNPIWVKTNRENISALRLYIIDGRGHKRTFNESNLTCSLVFIPF